MKSRHPHLETCEIQLAVHSSQSFFRDEYLSWVRHEAVGRGRLGPDLDVFVVTAALVGAQLMVGHCRQTSLALPQRSWWGRHRQCSICLNRGLRGCILVLVDLYFGPHCQRIILEEIYSLIRSHLISLDSLPLLLLRPLRLQHLFEDGFALLDVVRMHCPLVKDLHALLFRFLLLESGFNWIVFQPPC